MDAIQNQINTELISGYYRKELQKKEPTLINREIQTIIHELVRE